MDCRAGSPLTGPLAATNVSYDAPKLKTKQRKQGMFHHIEAFEFTETEGGKATGAWLELSRWLPNIRASMSAMGR